MKHYIIAFLTIFTILTTSCRNDFDFEPNVGNLKFSRDTIYLDTVFTTIGSSTYTLKVYNKSDKNISIPNLRLGKGESSKYRLMVDGMPGKVFENVELLAKDSMFIFIEVTADVADANPGDFLYTDQIQFGNNSEFQTVELVTLIQDAYFIFPQRTLNPDDTYTYESLTLGLDEEGNPITIQGQFLDSADPDNGNELHWTNEKPYVIYGYAAVPPNETLVVDAGARIHFHAESGLIIANNASLHVEGGYSSTEDLENEVIFEGDRLEPDFSEVPGQWGTIWFTQGSTNNMISNLTIKNATVGMLIEGNDGTSTPTVDMQNIQIYNCSNVGILARTANITGKNMVVNKCGQASIACTLGGSYEFTHCTFANYWPVPNQFCVVLNDYLETANQILVEPLVKAEFKNCILYGSPNLSLSIDKQGNGPDTNDPNFNYLFDSCLLKFVDSSHFYASNPLYQFTGANYLNSLIATNTTSNRPDFKDPNNNELIIGEDSFARGLANSSYSTFNDILNNQRNLTVGFDSGAYNWTTFN